MRANILITSISRKVWLVEAFRQAFKILKVTGRIITVDIDPLSVGLYFSNRHYLVSSVLKKRFLGQIFRICMRENIRLIVPTRNEELRVFAENINLFKKHNIMVMVSDPVTIETCLDKYKFYLFLKKNKIPAPRTIIPSQIAHEKLKYPLIIKSKTGSGSRNLFRANSREELDFFVRYVQDPIIQEFIPGKEYTVDLFSDFDGEIISITPRERVAVVSGESYKGRTVNDQSIIAMAKKFAGRIPLRGHITLQVIKHNKRLKLIEVNPRFGGGAMLGIKAGSNTPLFLLRSVLGRKNKPQIHKFKKNMVMLRYTKDYFLLENKIILR